MKPGRTPLDGAQEAAPIEEGPAAVVRWASSVSGTGTGQTHAAVSADPVCPACGSCAPAGGVSAALLPGPSTHRPRGENSGRIRPRRGLYGCRPDCLRDRFQPLSGVGRPPLPSCHAPGARACRRSGSPGRPELAAAGIARGYGAASRPGLSAPQRDSPPVAGRAWHRRVSAGDAGSGQSCEHHCSRQAFGDAGHGVASRVRSGFVGRVPGGPAGVPGCRTDACSARGRSGAVRAVGRARRPTETDKQAGAADPVVE